jgi:ribosome-binding factor A
VTLFFASEVSSMSKHRARRDRHDRSPEHSSQDADPQAAGHRHERLQRLLREELDALVRDELADPRLDGVTFTRVELSVDYKNARVGFIAAGAVGASRDAREHLERLLTRASPFLRARLADSVELKVVPALRFTWDAYAATELESEPGATTG